MHCFHKLVRLSTDESRQNTFVSRKESFLPTISSPKRIQATEAFAPSRQEPRNRTFVPVQTTAPREPTWGQAVWPLYDDWKDESTKQRTPVLRQQNYKELLRFHFLFTVICFKKCVKNLVGLLYDNKDYQVDCVTAFYG